ncbi:MAG: hypothetical protein ABIR38_02355 [Chthoniobacterales bacterium]
MNSLGMKLPNDSANALAGTGPRFDRRAIALEDLQSVELAALVDVQKSPMARAVGKKDARPR